MDINVNKHSSIRIDNIYIDPFKLEENRKDAKYVFITHSHYDHMSIEDIKKVSNDETIFVGPSDVINELKKNFNNKFVVVESNNHYQFVDITFETFPSYNINKKFHPFCNGWLGYIISVNDVKYAILGDSDLTEEVKNIKCDVLFVPIGGTYTMDAKEAGRLINIINPSLVVPVHYNDIVGSKDDEKMFLRELNKVPFKLFL